LKMVMNRYHKMQAKLTDKIQAIYFFFFSFHFTLLYVTSMSVFCRTQKINKSI
jgi:hypothetical protein